MDKREARWTHWIELAKTYRSLNGDLLVSRDYTTPNGEKLGRWIERQRAAYHGKGTCMLDQDRILKLEQLGMVWELEVRTDWDSWIDLCRAYLREHGDLRVPKTMKQSGRALGEWICRQRQLYHSGRLTELQQLELEALHMVWSVNERVPWMEWFGMAKQYYEEYGDLRVPLHYVTPEGKKLGRWICIQRDRYYTMVERWKNHKGRKPLSKQQIVYLNSIGMPWGQYRTRKAATLKK